MRAPGDLTELGPDNMPSSQRRAAIAAPADPAWMAGGTYMAFLRVQVDVSRWRTLPRAHQELLVGRDKLTGGAVVDVRRDATGEAAPIPAPVPGDEPSDREIADFVEPAQTTDPLLEASHIHRANQNRASPYAAAGMRMYRQGYDYLEDIGPDGPRLGLNFVSFQRDLAVLNHVMHLPGWLGDVNFGGTRDPAPGEPPNVHLLSVTAGGLFAVPPAGDPYPGASLLESKAR